MRRRLTCLVLLVALLCPFEISAQQTTLKWNRNTESDVDHYEVYGCTSSSSCIPGTAPSDRIGGDVAQPAVGVTPSLAIPTQTSGRAAVLAVDLVGNKSSLSNTTNYANLVALASSYPGDVGICSDPAVKYCQDFETGTLTEMLATFTSTGNSAGMSLVTETPPNSPGTKVLKITSVGGSTSGGNLYKKFTAGYSELHLRYKVKYPSDGGLFHHSGVFMGGYNPLTDFPQGTAGIIPNGSDFFHDAAQADILTTSNPFRMEHYAQWPGMQPQFGNYLMDGQLTTFVADTWHDVEIMIKLNDPLTDTNGEVAFWLDGVKVSHLGKGFPLGFYSAGRFAPDPSGTPFPGFQWATTASLPINWINIQHYMDDNPVDFVGYIEVDHIVIATHYIGPVSGTAPPPPPPGSDFGPPAPPSGVILH